MKPSPFPDERDAVYVLSDGDIKLQTFALAFTLQGVIVTDHGDMMGVAYTEEEPLKVDPANPCQADWNKPVGAFHVVALSSNGTERFHERHPQPNPHKSTHSPLKPYAVKLFQFENNALAALWTIEHTFSHRVHMYDLERWQLKGTYEIPAFKQSPDGIYAPRDSYFVQDMIQIKPHAFVLVQKLENERSAWFELLDSSATVVWSLVLKDDYVGFVPKRNEEEIRVSQRILKHPQMVMRDKPGLFAICSAKSKLCTEYVLQSTEPPISVVEGDKFPFNWEN